MQRESYITEMLQNNNFRTILPVSMIRTGDDCVLSFRADGMQSFARRFGIEAPDWKKVQALVRSITACILEMQDYLLPPEGMVLSAAYIFQDTGKEGYRFLYSTAPEKSFAASMKQLFEEIMPEFSHENREDVIAFYELYGKFLDEQFTPAMLLQVVEDWDRKIPGRGKGEAGRIRDKGVIREKGVITEKGEIGEKGVIREKDVFSETGAYGRSDLHADNAAPYRGTAYGGSPTKAQKINKEPVVPRWLVLSGIIAAVAGAALYLIFGRTAIKGIALLGVVYVVLIILHLHSNEKDETKEEDVIKQRNDTKQRDDTKGRAYTKYDNKTHNALYGPEQSAAPYERKTVSEIDIYRKGADFENEIYRKGTDSGNDIYRKDTDTENVAYSNDDWENADAAGGEALQRTAVYSYADMPSHMTVSEYGETACDMVYAKGETSSAPEYGETAVLCAPPAPLTRLVPAENGERMPITLNKGVCRIGRVPEDNEYCIPVPGISRVHAKISCDEGMVLIRDMHSTNGTYVNNERIREDDTKELHYGDVVSFAGEEYYCV